MSTIEQPKTKLPLDSLEIKGYRCFKELTIPKLARVNLITGKNGVGKSSLLEAIWLYAKGGNPQVINILLGMRHEFSSHSRFVMPMSTNAGTQPQGWLQHVSSMFFNRAKITGIRQGIEIGPFGGDDESRLMMSIRWFKEEVNKRGTIKREVIDLSDESSGKELLVATPHLSIKPQYRDRVDLPFDRSTELGVYWIPYEPMESYFFQARGMASSDMAYLWNKVALSRLEDEIVAALHIVNPRIERISLLSDQDSPNDLIPFAKLSGGSERVSIRSLGDGVSRLFFIMLSSVSAQHGVLLLDEIENGLHYSVLRDVWRTIFDLANRLNVQVFATTHSWECIQAFQEALWSSDENDGELVRLENKNDSIVSTVFDRRGVKVVAEDWIEVR